MPILQCLKMITLLSLLVQFSSYASDTAEKELKQFWQEAEQTVSSGDFQGYAATFDADAIMVSDIAKTSYPISKALARWQQGFDDTKAGKMKAGVSFKFTQSLVSENTAYQTGYFYYYSINKKGEKSPFIAKFEALLSKQSGQWKVVMERHIEQVDLATWQAL